MNAYQFWYRSDDYAPTEYIWIISDSPVHALNIFASRGYNEYPDYSDDPSDIIPESEFETNHIPGEILGINAII